MDSPFLLSYDEELIEKQSKLLFAYFDGARRWELARAHFDLSARGFGIGFGFWFSPSLRIPKDRFFCLPVKGEADDEQADVGVSSAKTPTSQHQLETSVQAKLSASYLVTFVSPVQTETLRCVSVCVRFLLSLPPASLRDIYSVHSTCRTESIALSHPL